MQIISALALAFLLSACSAVKIAYNQSPDIAYWYLDSYVDFTGSQSLQMKEDLQKLQTWHRQTQLPAYVEMLQKIQQQMPADIQESQVCALVADVRSKLLTVADRAEPVLATLMVTLSTEQLAQMKRKFADGNTDYREDYVEATPKAVRNKRYKLAVDRAEKLYGKMSDQQLIFIGQRVDNSPFNAALSYAERLRRQRDALAIFTKAIETQHTPEQNRSVLKALTQRLVNSPDAANRTYMEALKKDGCKNVADLHNRTTAAQRIKAVEALQGYEQDLKTLIAQNSAQ